MKITSLIAATGVLLSTAALADTTAPVAQPAQTPHTSSTAVNTDTMQQQFKADLQKAGYSDVKVVPDSFLVQAKDKSGHPIMMMINPNSVTEIMDTNGSMPDQNTTSTGSTSMSAFTQVPTASDMSSKIVGLDVYNNAHQDIGTIKDIAYDGARIKAYIVGVGGFLGMGEHYVAIQPSALHISYDAGAKTWHAAMNTTADQLKGAPEFKYTNAS